MKKIIMIILIILSMFIMACDNHKNKTYYSVNVECDILKGNVLISGSKNSEGKYTGNVEVKAVANYGYVVDYYIDQLSNELVTDNIYLIEDIDRDYNIRVFFKEDNLTIDNAYYESISSSLIGNSLKIALRNLITTTHTYKTSYDDCKKLSYISKTDGDPNKPGYIILFWSNLSIPCQWDSGSTWNREHVWPQSTGWFTESGAGSDLHHIRPTDPSVNTSHGNNPYGIVAGGKYVKTSSKNGSIATECKVGNGYFEPVDNKKGDCARIIFYLHTRYSESDMYSISSVAYSMDLLLEWNELDPVDQLEKNRNNAVYEIQGNRNPFIDNSDYADLIWG